MKKVFLSMAVSLLASSAFADVTNGEYLIKDVASGKFLGGANSWGTQASLLQHGSRFTLTKLENGTYNLDSHTYNSTSSHFFTGTYVDGGATAIYLTPAGSNFVMSTAAESAFLGTDGNIVENNVTSADAAVQWQFLTIKEATDAFQSASETNPVDATFLIKNAAVSRNLYNQASDLGWLGNPTIKGDNTNMNAEKFSCNFDVYQEISVPNGTYVLSCQGFYRAGGFAAAASSREAGTEAANAYLYANEQQIALPSIFADAKSAAESGFSAETTLGFIPNSQADASVVFSAGLYRSGKVTVTVTNGTLRLGIKKNETIDQDWSIFDNFELYCVGLSSLTEYQDAFAALVKEAEELAKQDMEESLRTALLAACATPEQTAEAYDAAIKALTAAINNARLGALRMNYVAGTNVSQLAADAWVGQTNTYGSRAERYNTAMYTGDVMYQTISGLRPGNDYWVNLTASASYTSGRGFDGKTGDSLSFIYANADVRSIAVKERTGVAENEFDRFQLKATVGKDGVLTFGLKNIADGGNWFVIAVDSIVSAGNGNIASYSTVYISIDALNAAIQAAAAKIVSDKYEDLVQTYGDSLNLFANQVSEVAKVADSLYAELAMVGKADSLIALLPTVAQVEELVAGFEAAIAAAEKEAEGEEPIVQLVSVVSYSFDDATSPTVLKGANNGGRGHLDYSYTSVISGTPFLNVWGENNTNATDTIKLNAGDLSEHAFWTLEFDWAGYSGCNKKAGYTSVVAEDGTTLFSINDAADWGNTMALTVGETQVAALAVYPCNKASRISAATGGALNDSAYWHRVVVKGSADGVTLTITNYKSGETVVKNQILSATNVNPGAVLIQSGSAGSMAIDELSVNYAIEPTISPLASYSFDDAASPTVLKGANNGGRGHLDYSYTSVISGTPFLNVWGDNNTNATDTVKITNADLSAYAYWTLGFDWAGYSGCNKKAGFTSVVAEDGTTLFSISDAADWGNTMPLTVGETQVAALAVYPCNKASRISAATGGALNDSAYWHYIEIKGSEKGTFLTVTNYKSGEQVVKKVQLSEANVAPAALLIQSGSAGSMAVDQMVLNIASFEEVIQNPSIAVEGASYTSNLITMACSTEETVIKYTINGGDTLTYAEPFRVFEVSEIVAWAEKGEKSSATVTKVATAGVIATPTAAVVDAFGTTRTVVMACTTPGATIYYGETAYADTIVIDQTLACGIVAKLADAYVTDSVFVSDTLFVNFEAGTILPLNVVTFATVEQSDSAWTFVLNNDVNNIIGKPATTISYELYPSKESGTVNPGDTLTLATHQRITASASAEGFATSEPAVLWLREPAKLDLVWEICFDTIAQLVPDKTAPSISAETFSVNGTSFGQLTIGDSIINPNFGAFIGGTSTYLVRTQNKDNTGLEDYHTSSAERYVGIANLKKTQVLKFFTYRYDNASYTAVQDLFPSYNDVLEYDAANSTASHIAFNVVKDGNARLAVGRYLVFKDVAVYNNPDVTASPNIYIAGKEGDSRNVKIVEAEVAYPENQFTYYAISNGTRVDSTLVKAATDSTEAVYQVDTVTVFYDFAPIAGEFTVSKPNNTVVAYTEYEGKASEQSIVEIDCDSIYSLLLPTIAWNEKTEEGHVLTVHNPNLVEQGLYPQLKVTFNGQSETGYADQTFDCALPGSGWFTVQAILPGMDTAACAAFYVAEARESYNENYDGIFEGNTLTTSGTYRGDIEIAAGAAVSGEYPSKNIAVNGTQFFHVAATKNFAVVTLPFAFTPGKNVVTDAKGNELVAGEDYEIATLHNLANGNVPTGKDAANVANFTNMEGCVRTSDLTAGTAILFHALSEKVGAEVILVSDAKKPVAVAATATTMPTSGWKIYGNKRMQNVALENSVYVLNAAGDKLVLTENPTIAPMGVALMAEAATVQALGNEILLVGDPSAIDVVEDAISQFEVNTVYDLQGRQVETLKKGQVYLINGRRYMVK